MGLSPDFQERYVQDLLPLADAEVYFLKEFLPPDRAVVLMEELVKKAAWRQEQIKLFGKNIEQPRLTAWYADAGKTYTYSGLTWEPQPLLPELLDIKDQLQDLTGASFNSALLNLYRSGQDSMGWHSDNEPELGPDPIIASVSLGQERTFSFKHREQKDRKYQLVLPAGSLLLMAGTTQHFWNHQLPKTTKFQEARINLTFRFVQ